MALTKKRRSYQNKHPRSQQQQKQAYNSSRLKPEQVGSAVHDESDTISFRSYILQNFIHAAELLDVLTTQPVPLSKIRPPNIYNSGTLESVKQRLASQNEELAAIRAKHDRFSLEDPSDVKFFKQKYRELCDLQECGELPQQKEKLESIVRDYASKFNIRLQDDSVVVHRGDFTFLRGDNSEAPADYWEKREQLLRQEEERKLLLKRQQEEEQERKIREEEEERKRQEAEQEAERKRQQEQQEQEAAAQAAAQQEQQVHQPQPPPQQGILDPTFGGLGAEPFNNGFDDGFGDLDTAFF